MLFRYRDMAQSDQKKAVKGLRDASVRGVHRVVHLTTVHDPRDPRILHKQLKTLRAAGYDAHLVAPQESSEPVDGIPITALPKVKGRYRRLVLQRTVYQQARKLDADLYHFHDPELIPVGYVLKRTTGATVLYDMHEDYRWHGPIEGRLLRTLERWCFTWVDHVVIANAHQIEITRPSSAPTTRIGNYFKPIGGAAACEQPARAPAEDGPLRAVYTGVMSNNGGRSLAQLIDLGRAMHRASFAGRLDLVGVCYVEAQRKCAAAQIRQHGLDAIIQRVGWDRYVPWEQMVPYLQRAHVGLVLGTAHPNQTRKIPTKFYEYLHFGLPILCSDFPRWRAFIERHDCGAVVPPGEVEAALTVLERWQKDPAAYRARSDAARAAAPQYRWQRMGERLVRLYDRLLGVKAPTG